MLALDEVIRVSAGRWSAPLLALAVERKGFRFAAAVATLRIARTVARRTIDELVAAGWLARNPGHGHPLRPEYVPTVEGKRVGTWCAATLSVRETLGIALDDLTRWTVPVVARLAAGEARFSELAATLGPVSPRALSQGLKQAMALRLVERRLEDRFPPVAVYRLAARGEVLAGAMVELQSFPARGGGSPQG